MATCYPLNFLPKMHCRNTPFAHPCKCSAGDAWPFLQTCSAGLSAGGSLVGVAVPAAQGGREQAQLALILNKQKGRLAQLQTLQNLLQAELQAAGEGIACKTHIRWQSARQPIPHACSKPLLTGQKEPAAVVVCPCCFRHICLPDCRSGDCKLRALQPVARRAWNV